MAVCDKTYQIYRSEPYRDHVIPVEPYQDIPLEEAEAFDCSRDTRRHPRESKGEDYAVTDLSAADCCEPEGCC